MNLLPISTFHLDTDSQLGSPWQKLAPRTRVLCVLLLVFAIALTPNGHWETWAVYGLGVFAIALLSRINLAILVQRVAVEFIFIGVVLLGTLFRSDGDVIWQWGWLQITSTGLVVLGSVALKALLSLTVLNILIQTTPIPALLHALAGLRMPPLLIAILASMYRYLAVLFNEVISMQRAAISRNLMASRSWHRIVVGHMMGSLFIRTYDRGNRIYQAMLARGYNGLIPMSQFPSRNPSRKRWDVLALTLTTALAIFGQTIYLLGLRF
jgi:cobalt/nickel transport system permease protein